MSKNTASRLPRLSPTWLVSGVLVLAGTALSFVSAWFIVVAALGLLGPGILRELGWLQDQDEFQARAAHRAGYHAFLVAGLASVALIALLRSTGLEVRDAAEIAFLFPALLGLTWLTSSLFSFWGPQSCARRLLVVFGACLLLFAVLSNVGSEWTGWAALLLHPLLAAPFFGLAWIAGRWPRSSGALLLAVAAFFFQFLHLFQKEHMGLLTDGFVFLMVVGPLLAAGIALLAARPDEDDEAAFAGSSLSSQ